MEKKGAEDDVEAGEEDDDEEQVDGDIGAEEVEGDGEEEEDVDGNMEVDDDDDDVNVGGRFEIRSLGLGIPCLQGKLRNLVQEKVLKIEKVWDMGVKIEKIIVIESLKVLKIKKV